MLFLDTEMIPIISNCLGKDFIYKLEIKTYQGFARLSRVFNEIASELCFMKIKHFL